MERFFFTFFRSENIDVSCCFAGGGSEHDEHGFDCAPLPLKNLRPEKALNVDSSVSNKSAYF